ncbi:glycoside hydrolase family 32 protein [Singulisphaera sp. PoT]|uniref:glycoside hydrolase family 32 protein n=1 Tax=Singulisphaera sp. PoT TaxID=3411797 RepID=UPI003BF6130B
MKPSILLLAGLALLSLQDPTPARGQSRPDMVISDFEGSDYGGWVAQGTAFGKAPARGTLPNQMGVSDYHGEGLVNSYVGGDDSQGTLTSPEFTIERKHINFLIGGGDRPGLTGIHLVVDGKVVRTATGPARSPSDTERLRPRSWDVADLAGVKARIEIVDKATGGWGHINVDNIIQSDVAPIVRPEREAALAEAAESVGKAAPRAQQDARRPVYHFRPTAFWMNDPNGPIFHRGYYHMFYQFNPYGDGWGNMHWGHARSKDLVHWEHLPIALWASKDAGEDHVFSGSAAVGPDGKLILYYTSIGQRDPEQWAAIAEDDDGISWKKWSKNPILSLKDHGAVKIDDWRDPFVFKEDGRWYMVVGGHQAGAKGGITLYTSDDQLSWKYVGIPFVGKEGNWECPNLFKLDGKWVLIYSPHGPVKYYTGALDLKSAKFTPEHEGTLDPGQYYAPNGLEDPKGRRILWGWINGFPANRGWNGCLTLPRVLKVAPDGSLIQQPAPELSALRESQATRVASTELGETPAVLPKVSGDTLEIEAKLGLGTAKAVGLAVRRSADGKHAVTIRYDGEQLDVAGVKVPLKLAEGEKVLRLHLYLDRSVVEVYADGGRVAVTRVVDAGESDLGVAAFAEGRGATLQSLDTWQLKPIW